MDRRKFITAAGTLGVAGVAGCLNSGSGSTGTKTDTLTVEVGFKVTDNDLVVKHTGGDVLQSGEQVYIIVSGEKLKETTLSKSVHVGGEIIRVKDIKTKYDGDVLVGLYVKRGGSSVELGSQKITIPSRNAPSTQLKWDYEADTQKLMLYHDGGSTINDENTQQLQFANGPGSMSFASSNSYIDSDGTVTGAIQAGDLIGSGSFPADESVDLVWIAPNGDTSATLGSFEGPQAR